MPSSPCCSSARTDTGHSTRSRRSSTSSPRAVEQPVQSAADAGEHDVVDGAADRLADRLDLGERDAHDRQQAVPTRARVDRRARRDRLTIDHRARTTGRARRPARPRGAGRAASTGTNGRARRARSRVRARLSMQQLRRARRGLGRPLLHEPARTKSGRHVEQQGRDVDAGHAVDERVVRLLDERDVTVFEPLDEPQLPQRPLAVEQVLLHARRERDELLPRARASAARCAARGT